MARHASTAGGAHQLVGQADEAPWAHVCDTHYTCGEDPQERLPAGDPHRGLHHHLPKTATLLSSP
ncbi:hypothetical protein [Streptomyces sp. NPDC018000]|uniref:hypothetical protein n=1 Tax=Streptomyces sp. NPDC018000 TaxID=3365028 RepID=UPI0037970A56